MKINEAYKFRAYPTVKQEQQLSKTIGCSRKVYNLLLGENISLYEKYKNGDISQEEFRDLKKSLNYSKFKAEHPYLKEVDCNALKYAQRHLKSAYSNFFQGHGEYPVFKSKHKSKLSYTTCRDRKTGSTVRSLRLTKGGKLKLPKVKDPIKVVVSRNPKGTLVSATITKEASGKWFVSLLYERHVPTPQLPKIPQSPEALDLGIKSLATDTQGNVYPNPKNAYKYKEKIAKLDRKLSRQREQAKKDGRNYSDSSNYQKTKRKRARAYEKVKNARLDNLHKVTTTLVNDHDFIGLEDLSPSDMLKNHNLAYAISDASWGIFASLLAYKAQRKGAVVRKIGRFTASTQICSACGEKTWPKGVSQLNTRFWTCPLCDASHDRDVNAAKNILQESLTAYLQSTATVGTTGGDDIKQLQSLANNAGPPASSQEKSSTRKPLDGQSRLESSTSTAR